MLNIFLKLPKIRFLLGVLVIALVFVPRDSFAQAPEQTVTANLKLQERALFRQMLLSPNNVDIAFRYSEVATKLGDLEAAIGALERILFYNANLPRVRVELGLLYYRLGSYEQARSYFKAAIAAPDTQPDVKDRVNGFLREIDRRASINQFTFSAQTGFRHQSNANAGPLNGTVRALGQDATLSSQFRKKSDWNAFGAATARHVFDFENQRGDTWETSSSGYYARQFKLTRLNLGVVELETGPRFTLGEATGLSVRPYVIGNVITLDDRGYSRSGGGGVSFAWQTAAVLLTPGIEYRIRDFSNSQNYTNARDQKGSQLVGTLAASGSISAIEGLRFQAKLNLVANSAREKFYSYNQIGLDFSLPYEFVGLGFSSSRKWTLSPYAGFTVSRYKEPNQLIDPDVKRFDREWRIGATLDAPISQNIGFAAQIQYGKTLSNLKNYRTDNLSVTFGPTVQF